MPKSEVQESKRVCRGCGARGRRLSQEAHKAVCERADVVAAESGSFSRRRLYRVGRLYGVSRVRSAWIALTARESTDERRRFLRGRG